MWKVNLDLHREVAKNPQFWSRVCLQNMANLGKEATTMRRVLESLFRYFDSGNLWPIQGGIAFPVLRDMQLLMDDSGQVQGDIFPLYIYMYLFFSGFITMIVKLRLIMLFLCLCREYTSFVVNISQASRP